MAVKKITSVMKKLVQHVSRYGIKGTVIKAMNKLPSFYLTNLQVVRVEITNHCNLCCKICDRKALFQKRRPEHMSMEMFTGIIDEVARLKVPNLLMNFYGESMMHPKFFEMLDYVTKKKLYPSIITNGMKLTDENIDKLLNSCMDRIEISFHGAPVPFQC